MYDWCILTDDCMSTSNFTHVTENAPAQEKNLLLVIHQNVTGEKNGNNIFHRPGIEPGPSAWQANTLPRRYKSRLVLQVYHIPILGDIYI